MILEKFFETIKTPSPKHFEQRFKNFAVRFQKLLLFREVYIYIVRMEMYSMCERATVSKAREYESERTHVAIPSLVCAWVSRYVERRCATRCSLSLLPYAERRAPCAKRYEALGESNT